MTEHPDRKCIKRLMKKGLIPAFIIIAAALALLLSLFLSDRHKGESRIEGLAYYESVFPEDSYHAYLQGEDAWGGYKLGDSRDTMRGSGCLTCCIAASLNAQGVYDYTPGELNQVFNDNHVYNENGAIVWDSLEKALPQAGVELDRKTSSESINRLLEEGKYPIVKVKRQSGAVHWIMLTGTEKETYDIIAMDPIDGRVHMSDYGSRIYGVRVVTGAALHE